MRLIKVDCLLEGHIPAQNIYDSHGNVIIRKGVELKQHYIDLLREKYKISYVYIEDHRTDDIDIQPLVPEELRFSALRLIKQFFDDLRNKPLSTVKIDNYIEQATALVHDFIEAILRAPSHNYNFLDIKPYDDYTSAHSVNVMTLTIATGLSMGWGELELSRAALGAFLHDIGKAFVPLPVLDKPDKLTQEEFELIKKHPSEGYSLVKELVSPTVSSIIRDHHERIDGSGYPNGKASSEIAEYAKVVSVCDVYDALTSDRVYKKRVLPYFALKIIEGSVNSQFDAEVSMKFARAVVPYPKGTPVLLSNNLKGVVKKINVEHRTRPVVKVLLDQNNEDLIPYQDLDLSKHSDIRILKVLDDI